MPNNRSVLVTGASSGIGFAVAKEFSSRGYKVIAGARRLSSMEELAQLNVKTIELDITSLESVKKLKLLIEAEYNGELMYLLNNAGQACMAPAMEVSDERAEQCLQVNLLSQIRVTRELTPYVINAKGAIGFTGSIAGITNLPFVSMYSCAKAALSSYASSLAYELEPFDVKVLHFITGSVPTGFTDSVKFETSYYDEEGLEDYFAARSDFGKKGPTPEIHAEKIVNDFESSKLGVVDYYRGGKALFVWSTKFMPRFLFSFMFVRALNLQKLFSNIRKKYSSLNPLRHKS
ncbi:NADPH-dependent 1-acyl dihydroxyacetone phosphate reductase [Yamadazyma tenuis]|uniref:NAD(P)-binding protein n=1 Tax=Candida tenuis (strain ATCC 10573 / BCRC 21748 / CBS 615 / JCM 9827 / NBRC 10315 / NRRL Y-1498 / VKM Y-70) TaxID=590646 RepID=G3BEM0_CANTC|nr:uncharacterized protein CANTEDRAFT_110295 [Yamadazyma tenuis ATCC 10573]EGV59926.1 hypothetical protein CANTEDRAFT_110295 [Yamadazyma tenuis ATCC 10573]WEJ94854.1 NADPH-dependent 1-acyl dihydroxyacetone phosphate reductase [Yamadazyma tenuis]